MAMLFWSNVHVAAWGADNTNVTVFHWRQLTKHIYEECEQVHRHKGQRDIFHLLFMWLFFTHFCGFAVTDVLFPEKAYWEMFSCVKSRIMCHIWINIGSVIHQRQYNIIDMFAKLCLIKWEATWPRPDDSLSSCPCPAVCFCSPFLFFISLAASTPFLLCTSYPSSTLSLPFSTLVYLSATTSVLYSSDFTLPPVLIMHCLVFLCLVFFSSLLSHQTSHRLLSFYLCISSTQFFSLFASAMITTHSFNQLPLRSGEVEVMGVFCLKLSAQLLKSGNKQYLSCFLLCTNEGFMRPEVARC